VAFETTADSAATTYATVALAQARAELRGGAVAAAVRALSDDDILAGLTSRSIDIDTLDWIGARATAEQELEWPRTDTDYSETAWPTRLVNAVIEQFFVDAVAGNVGADATTDPLTPDVAASNVKREKVGPIETEYFTPTVATDQITSVARFAPIVQSLLAPLIRSTSEGEWGTSIATRRS
jgi:hypothetical protein